MSCKEHYWVRHKDDFEFTLNGEAIKRFGSQGQQKTFIISLETRHSYDFLSDKNRKKTASAFG